LSSLRQQRREIIRPTFLKAGLLFILKIFSAPLRAAFLEKAAQKSLAEKNLGIYANNF
jgi:hypothetical protein